MQSIPYTIICFEPKSAPMDYGPGLKFMRYFMLGQEVCMFIYPTCTQELSGLFYKLGVHVRYRQETGDQSGNETLKLWRKTVPSNSFYGIAYNGDEKKTEVLNFTIKLETVFDRVSMEDTDEIYVRSLADLEPLMETRIKHGNGREAVLRRGSSVSAFLADFEQDGRRMKHGRHLKPPVPVIGVMELIHASFGDYFHIRVTNPRAAFHWSLVRSAWKAFPLVKHWIHEANMPRNAAATLPVWKA